MARIGKIARLPAAIRTELNQRLRDGQIGPQVLPWLNSLPETQALLTTEFGGKPINPQNLSDWRQGGFVDWERSQDRFYDTRLLAERASSLASEAGISLSEGAAAILSGRILELLEGLEDKAATPEALAGLIRSVALLRSGDHNKLKIEQQQSELNLARQKFQRDTCELFLQWSADQRAAEVAASPASHADKIERLGALMFGEGWRESEGTKSEGTKSEVRSPMSEDFHGSHPST